MTVKECHSCNNKIGYGSHICPHCYYEYSIVDLSEDINYHKSDEYLKETFPNFDFNKMSKAFKKILIDMSAERYKMISEYTRYWELNDPVIETINIQISSLEVGIQSLNQTYYSTSSSSEYERRRAEQKNDEIREENRRIEYQNQRIRNEISRLEDRKSSIYRAEPEKYLTLSIEMFGDTEDERLNDDERFEIELLKGILHDFNNFEDDIDKRESDIERNRRSSKNQTIQKLINDNFGKPSIRWIWNNNTGKLLGYHKMQKYKEGFIFSLIGIVVGLIGGFILMIEAFSVDDNAQDSFIFIVMMVGFFALAFWGGYHISEKVYNDVIRSVRNEYSSKYDSETYKEKEKIRTNILQIFYSKTKTHISVIEKYLLFMQYDIDYRKLEK